MLVCIYFLVIDKNDFLQELQWSETLETLTDEIVIECVVLYESKCVCVSVFRVCVWVCVRAYVCACVYVCAV